jgi:hypothetical protein
MLVDAVVCALQALYDPCHLLTCQGDMVVLGASKKAKEAKEAKK